MSANYLTLSVPVMKCVIYQRSCTSYRISSGCETKIFTGHHNFVSVYVITAASSANNIIPDYHFPYSDLIFD
uniref:Uncharacterized protein n=1 Tax=Arion vulgaris TaxID=1028688 RepID=A0A0B6YT52_9EUPU